MKRALFYIAVLIMLASCRQEELPLSEKAVGYLSIENLTVQTANVENIMTRAVDRDLYICIDDGAPYPPGADVSEIALEPGSHTLEAYNAAYNEYLGWTNEEKGSAVYYGKTSFEIKANNMTYVNMEVPMINFGVSLSLPEGFTTVFPQYAFSVTVGKRTVSLKDGETAYFPYSEGGLSVSYTLSATNTDGEDNDKEGNNSSWEGKSTIQPNTVYVITYDYGTKSLVLVP